MLRVFLIWSPVLIICAFVGSAIDFPWLIYVPLVCALIHALLVATRKR